jgi:EAL domain-containing protein (putative c-di-GMP-specific phosphodiesterase class I)
VPATCVIRHEHPEVFDRLVVWVNVAASQLTRPGFARHFLEQLAVSGTDPFAIGVEVTESALADHDGAMDALATLRAAGVRIAIDDFGTGYSSIARLRHYPVDLLKLDRAFTADLDTPAGRGVVTAVIELAHAVGALTLAEGVETPDQLELLRSLGCDRASGFYLARPMAAPELTRASLRRLSVAAS